MISSSWYIDWHNCLSLIYLHFILSLLLCCFSPLYTINIINWFVVLCFSGVKDFISYLWWHTSSFFFVMFNNIYSISCSYFFHIFVFNYLYACLFYEIWTVLLNHELFNYFNSLLIIQGGAKVGILYWNYWHFIELKATYLKVKMYIL